MRQFRCSANAELWGATSAIRRRTSRAAKGIGGEYCGGYFCFDANRGTGAAGSGGRERNRRRFVRRGGGRSAFDADARRRDSPRETLSDANGEFVFADVPPGAFQVVIAAAGLASQTYTGTKIADQASTVPTITLAVASESTQVQVSVSRVELAEDEIKIQEKQRVLGVFPNFYVSYDPDAVPLSSKQKFELAWRTTIDPVTFVLTGATAGVQQWQNNFSGYGQGAQGYAKRYGAIYADTVTGTFLGGAVFPSLFKQDPRYFYKGTGTVRSRFLYAIANAVICKGDNRKWQPAYSSIFGRSRFGRNFERVLSVERSRGGAGV